MLSNTQVGDAGKTLSRRAFIATSGAAVVMSTSARGLGESQLHQRGGGGIVDAIHFPGSFLHCSPTDSGIWVRVQVACRGCLTDLATGQTDEYVLGVMAKTGLTPDPDTGGRAPGYDYWIIFSRSHVFTKRSHTSAYFNNPTVLKHAEFGSADWRLKHVGATAVTTGADIRRALEGWHELSATTTFTSSDGARQYSIDYPVRWADFMRESDGFRVETGPVFLMDPDKQKVGRVPAFEDFRWAHLDYRSFDKVRLLIERKTSILEGATFNPPNEHGRQGRENPGLTRAQLQQIKERVFSEQEAPLPQEKMRDLFSTDHYSKIEEVAAKTQIFSFMT